jgi:hypothetical protein
VSVVAKILDERQNQTFVVFFPLGQIDHR